MSNRIVARIWVICCLFLFTYTSSKGQICTTCTDPINCPANPTYSCPGDYRPVCGCDGKTYRNVCVAAYRNGLNIGMITDGPCGPYDYDITPNYGSYELNLQVWRQESGYVLITIFNAYGIIETSYPIYVPSASSSGGYAYPYQLDIESLDTGIYILELVFDGERQVKKFFKYAQ